MTQTQNPDAVNNFLSAPDMTNLSVTLTDDNIFRITKKVTEPPVAMELPVNNYLKAPEEIEREFHIINSHKAAFNERKDSPASPGPLISKTDGYLNIHSLEAALSGSMEENY